MTKTTRVLIMILAVWSLTPLLQLQAQELSINEVMASNATTIADDDGDFEDWIELHNYGQQVVHLHGFGLSDNYENPFKWVFPEVQIPAGGYLLVWASGKNRINPQQQLHTNFSISAGGEELILNAPDGTRLDELTPTAIPTDLSYGRFPDGAGEWRFFTSPSPGAPNTGPAYPFILPAVDFSAAGGAFADEFFLSLSHPNKDAQIIYTLDGSVPEMNDNNYQQAIHIRNRQGDPNDISLIPTNNNPDPGPPYYEGWQPPAGEVFKVNVVRARAFHPDAPPGPVTTHTFLVHHQAEGRFSIPWFSLNTNRENLFDNETGIYVHGNHTNFFQDGPEWERPANLSFFETNGLLQFNEDIGIRTHGNTTRSRPRKSLRISSRAEYGNSWINYQLFPDKPTADYKRFILRNSGNDWDFSVFRDAFIQHLAKHLHVETQYYRPAILFINGEYWGIHNVRDRYNHHYIEAKYGIAEDEMTIMENNSVFKFGNPAGRDHYVSMRNFISNNNMANAQHFETVKTMMDIESFTDFQLTHIYSMNTDWPGNNVLYWRYLRDDYAHGASERDGRWRWMILDTDFGFGLNFFYVPGVNQGASHNTLAFALESNGPGWPNPPWSTLMLRRLVNNQEYRNYFINRFADLLNTTFSASHAVHVLDSIQAALEPEMQEHIDRWRRPVSLQSWQQEVQLMRNFANQRVSWMRSHIRSQFNLSGTADVQLSVNDPGMGSIGINTIEPMSGQSWTGVYFRGIPLNIRAIPKPGYRFVEWTGSHSGQSENIEITPAGNIQLTAVFELSDDFQGDEMNPPAYRLANGPYAFNFWSQNNPEGSFPPNMIFQQSNINDPRLDDEMTHPYHIPEGEYHADDLGSIGFPYRLTRRTRINGLNENGISFINTGRGRDLGAAVLALDTRGLEDIRISFTAGTVQPNSRAYALRLQYRAGHEGAFVNLTDSLGSLIEYERSADIGHETVFSNIFLPQALSNQAYVQLRWKYYYTGLQTNPNSGARDEIRLDNISVVASMTGTENHHTKTRLLLEQNFPNPFSHSTTLRFYVAESGMASLKLYNHAGMLVKNVFDDFLHSGFHELTIDGSKLPEGLYIAVLTKNGHSSAKKIVKLH